MRLFVVFFIIFNFHLSAQNSKIFEKKDFWIDQKKGANCFNIKVENDYFILAKNIGIEFIRLACDKFQSDEKDFLIGSADNFTSINKRDFLELKKILDLAYKSDVKIVLTMLSLPGCRWSQNNNNKNDFRIYKEKKYQKQAALFWRQIALLLKDHPSIVGYNILNEPHPEVIDGYGDFREINFDLWYQNIQNSCSDLNKLYSKIIKKIRSVDQKTPIILDSGLYANPWAIKYLKPIKDGNIFYSFHMYEPFNFTNFRINKEKFSYPGFIPSHLSEELKNEKTYWNFNALVSFFEPVFSWQKKYNILSNKIILAEFGCSRKSMGASDYLKDIIKIANDQKWHWAFYSFREDNWDDMDYELGDKKVSYKYWDALEIGNNLNEFRKDNALFDVIKSTLSQSPLPKRKGLEP